MPKSNETKRVSNIENPLWIEKKQIGKEDNGNDTENPLMIEKDENTDESESSGDEGDCEDNPIKPEVTYCKHVGILGTMLLLFTLLISGIMVFLFYLYSYNFQNLEREMVWIFLVLGITYAISPLVLLRSWKRTAEDDFDKMANPNLKKRRNIVLLAISLCTPNNTWNIVFDNRSIPYRQIPSTMF